MLDCGRTELVSLRYTGQAGGPTLNNQVHTLTRKTFVLIWAGEPVSEPKAESSDLRDYKS